MLSGAALAELSGRIVLVTGTDTGVGKTHASAALASAFAARGERTVYLKPVQTGAGFPGTGSARAGEGNAEPPDVALAASLAPGVPTAQGWQYAEPMAPVLAAEVEGAALPTLDELVEWVRGQAAGFDRVIVEGAGGLLVELCPGGDIPALAARLADGDSVSVVLVMRPGLGTLNHTGLSLEALRARGIEPHLLLSGWPAEPTLTERLNLRELRGMGRWLGCVDRV